MEQTHDMDHYGGAQSQKAPRGIGVRRTTEGRKNFLLDTKGEGTKNSRGVDPNFREAHWGSLQDGKGDAIKKREGIRGHRVRDRVKSPSWLTVMGDVRGWINAGSRLALKEFSFLLLGDVGLQTKQGLSPPTQKGTRGKPDFPGFGSR